MPENKIRHKKKQKQKTKNKKTAPKFCPPKRPTRRCGGGVHAFVSLSEREIPTSASLRSAVQHTPSAASAFAVPSQRNFPVRHTPSAVAVVRRCHSATACPRFALSCDSFLCPLSTFSFPHFLLHSHSAAPRAALLLLSAAPPCTLLRRFAFRVLRFSVFPLCIPCVRASARLRPASAPTTTTPRVILRCVALRRVALRCLRARARRRCVVALRLCRPFARAPAPPRRPNCVAPGRPQTPKSAQTKSVGHHSAL